jgi:hypothetical protein
MELLLDRLRASHQVEGLTLEGLKLLAQSGAKANLVFMLRPFGNGYALQYDLKRTFGCAVSGWYIAERSKKIRRFATVEAAISVARELGLRELRVQIAAPADFGIEGDNVSAKEELGTQES